MNKILPTTRKTLFLTGLILLYILIGFTVWIALKADVIQPLKPSLLHASSSPSEPLTSDLSVNAFALNVSNHMRAAMSYVDTELVKDGRVQLYKELNNGTLVTTDAATNSEALSYYLLWTAREGKKEQFDMALDYIEQYMIEEDYGFLMWRITPQGIPDPEGGANIASDADLRAILALSLARDAWSDGRYNVLLGRLADGLEQVGLTEDFYLAPYGGVSGSTTWTADETWLSYENFEVFALLAQERGEPWDAVYSNMKNATLDSQLSNGLFNQQLTVQRKQGNSLDAGAYSINSLWMMVRSAESGDPDLRLAALRSLQFYKQKYASDGLVYMSYNSDGTPASTSDAPWVYALVGRAAIELDDFVFAEAMLRELMSFQTMNPSSLLYGAIVEGPQGIQRTGQFTLQESILTYQVFLDKYE